MTAVTNCRQANEANRIGRCSVGGRHLDWVNGLTRQIIELGKSVIVYDDLQVSQMTAEMFTAEHWPDTNIAGNQSGGRGTILFVTHEGKEWAIRHYYRGGMVGKFLVDQYLWRAADSTRSFQEWALLHQMQAAGLPAPAPVAARYRRDGAWYTADLITRRLPGVESFVDKLTQGQANRDMWRAVGICVARFHAEGFLHADLNAWNIQIDAHNTVHILDWDRGRRLAPGRWRKANIARLERSLKKVSARFEFPLISGDWQALLDGYASQS